jgi:potassium efflux system protein
MIPNRIAFALICALLAPYHASGAAPPPAADMLKQPQSKREVTTVPEPVALVPEWWRFFEVPEQEKLERRVKEAIARLEQLMATDYQQAADSARPLVERIRSNLSAYVQARREPSPTPPAPVAFQEKYSIAQLVDISARLQSATDAMAQQRDDVDADQSAVGKASNEVDTLLARYLELDKTSPSRLKQGLEIMAERSAVAVAAERVRVKSAALAASEARVKHLSEAQAAALTRLSAEPADLVRLNKEIVEAQLALAQEQERVVLARSRALEVAGESPEDVATARYRQQRTIKSGTSEIYAAARLLRLEAERQLTELLLPDGAAQTGQAREALSSWEAQVADLRNQVAIWKRESERERDRVGQAIAQPTEQDSALTPVKLINQERFKLAQESLWAVQALNANLAQVSLLLQKSRHELLLREGALQAWLADAAQTLEEHWYRALEWIDTSLFKIGDTPVTPAGVLHVVLAVLIAWILSFLLRRGLSRVGARLPQLSQGALYTVGRLSHYVLVILGVIVGLATIGIDFTNLALVAGALAIGVGFGLQSIVGNFVSGLILLFDRTVKVGDFVELDTGVVGEVKEINVRGTVINTNDNEAVVVPNLQLIERKLTNWTLLEGCRRIHIPFRVAYDVDTDVVRQAGLEAAKKLPHTMISVIGREPQVWLVGFGENGYEFELIVWVTPEAVKRPAIVHAAYTWEIHKALRKHGVEVPLPQRDLRLRSGFREAIAELGSGPTPDAKEIKPPLSTGVARATRDS